MSTASCMKHAFVSDGQIRQHNGVTYILPILALSKLVLRSTLLSAPLLPMDASDERLDAFHFAVPFFLVLDDTSGEAAL